MWQDLRFGLRTLGKNPGFAAVAIAALALGIGANATVFSLVNAILFKAPFPNSDSLLYISLHSIRDPDDRMGLSQPEYDEIRGMKSFAGIAAVARDRVNLSDDANAPDSFFSSRATTNAFTVAGLPPVLGRDFTTEDAKPGAAPVVILTYAVWQRRYGQDPSIVGRKIRVNTIPTMVIGVSAPGLAIPPETDMWTPYIPNPNAKRQERDLYVFGRLARGTVINTARSEMAVASRRLAEQYPETNRDLRFDVQTFTETALPKRIKVLFLALMGAVGFVLMIACANVANLLLARAAGREREMSIRAALGAGRWRVVRQLLIESLLLAAAGGLVGLTIAQWGIRAFDAAVTPTGKPIWIDFSMDYRVFGYLAAISGLTAIAFGLAPALRLSRFDLHSAIQGGVRAGRAIHGRYLVGVLVVVEMSLAVVLLTGAGLMIRSFLAAYTRPMGVDTRNVLTMHIELPHEKYGTPAKQLDFQRTLVERLRGLPGVRTAAVASGASGNGNLTLPFEIDGQSVDAEHRKFTDFLLAGDGYFETLGLTARRGRLLSPADYVAGPSVAVINQTMARQLWPGQDPIGRRIRFIENDGPSEWLTVVGVVPDYLNSMRPEPNAVAIIPFRQHPEGWMTAMARTQVPASSLANAVRREAAAIDPDLPVRQMRTLDEDLALSRWPLRVFGGMFTIFAAVSLLLATVGLYAVVAYGVSQRRQEIGVRMALGASTGSILRMVMAGGMRQAAVGLSLGMLAAFGITRVLKVILVGVSPTNPVTFGLAGGILAAAAIFGCAVPARRATRVDAAVALRQE
jgi:predicted permease